MNISLKYNLNPNLNYTPNLGLLLSETATLLCDVPDRVGEKLGEVVQQYPELLAPCMNALLEEFRLIVDLAEERKRMRFLLLDIPSVSEGAPDTKEFLNGKLLVKKETDCPLVSDKALTVSAEQGDLAVFYYSIAALRYLNQIRTNVLNNELTARIRSLTENICVSMI